MAEMRNKAMQSKLRDGDAIDVSSYPRVGRHYQVATFIDRKDYCDASTEQWIWSIGRRNSDGAIFASTTGDLYQNPNYECLWLR